LTEKYIVCYLDNTCTAFEMQRTDYLWNRKRNICVFAPWSEFGVTFLHVRMSCLVQANVFHGNSLFMACICV